MGRSWSRLAEWWRKAEPSESAPVSWFAADYYRRQLPSPVRENAWDHFARDGWRQGLDPHPWFDTAYYLSQRPDLTDSDPVTHFIEIGWRAGLKPHPLFDTNRYLQRAGDLGGERDPLAHYLKIGFHHRLSPHPLVDLRYAARTWKRAPDQDPLTVMLAVGMDATQRCHPMFHPGHLRLRQRFLEGAAAPPWTAREQVRRWAHWDTRWSPSPLFDPDFYVGRYPEAGPPSLAWNHFVEVGQFEGLDPNPYFDSEFYREHYGDQLHEQTPLAHYMTHERVGRFDPCEAFDVSHYLAWNPEARRGQVSPLEHFLEVGRYRGAEIAELVTEPFLVEQLREARSLDPTINITERDLVRMQRVNRHCAVRRSALFRTLLDQLETRFDVLILVDGQPPDPRDVELVRRLLARRPLRQSLVLATDHSDEAWRTVLPAEARVTGWDCVTHDGIEPTVRAELTQYLIEETRPIFTVLVDSSSGWRLTDRKGLALSQFTRLWGALSPNGRLIPDAQAPGGVGESNSLDVGELRGDPLRAESAWTHCQGIVSRVENRVERPAVNGDTVGETYDHEPRSVMWLGATPGEDAS